MGPELVLGFFNPGIDFEAFLFILSFNFFLALLAFLNAFVNIPDMRMLLAFDVTLLAIYCLFMMGFFFLSFRLAEAFSPRAQHQAAVF